MRLALCLIALLAAPASAQGDAPVRATTEDGRAILVYSDGTWRLDRSAAERPDAPAPPPPPPPAPPPVAEGARLRTVTSASGTYAIDYDANRWGVPGDRISGDTEFELMLPFSAAYAMTIYEAFPATNEQVRDFVLANAEVGTQAPVRVLSEVPIEVPGGDGLRIEFEGVAESGLAFVFITSAFGTDEGALQVTTFTSKSAIDRHRETMLQFHEGVRLLQP